MLKEKLMALVQVDVQEEDEGLGKDKSFVSCVLGEASGVPWPDLPWRS